MVIATAVCPMIEPPAVPRTATAVVSPIQLKQLTMESSGVSAGKRVLSPLLMLFMRASIDEYR
jgi:hypothetical protein